MSAGIVVEGLSHTYSRRTPLEQPSLKEVSFQIPAGERVALMGSMGSGKSSLLSHLAGLTPVQSGRVGLLGRQLATKADRIWARGQVGSLFQFAEHQLFCASVEEEILFGSRDLPEWAVTEALVKVGLAAQVAKRSPFSLSGGERRLVALACVLVNSPSILLLDEPTAGLDRAARERVLSRLMELPEVTILMVSHNPEEVAGFAERLLVLHQGELVADGKPREVFSDPRLRDWGLRPPELLGLALQAREMGCGPERLPLEPAEALEWLAGK